MTETSHLEMRHFSRDRFSHIRLINDKKKTTNKMTHDGLIATLNIT